MKKKKKEKVSCSFVFWRVLINFWTIFFMVVIVLDFIYTNSMAYVIGPMSAIYIGALAVYVGNKEFERWHDLHQGRHPGEIFVILWTLLIFAIIVADMFLQSAYELPAGVVSSYLAVLTILAITSKSKSLYRQQ